VSDLVLAPREELASVVQEMQVPEQRRLLDAIDNRRSSIHCSEATVKELFDAWKLSDYTQQFEGEGYALVGDLLYASNQDLDKLTPHMKPAEKSRLERTLEVWRPLALSVPVGVLAAPGSGKAPDRRAARRWACVHVDNIETHEGGVPPLLRVTVD
jgi:hypothetical protein